MSRGQKWAQYEKECPPSDRNHETKIWMTGEVGGDLLVRNRGFEYSFFKPSYNMLKNISQ